MSLICCFRMEREKPRRDTARPLVARRDRPQVWVLGGLAGRLVVVVMFL